MLPVRRRLLFVARTRYSLPLSASLARKFEPLASHFELRVLGTAGDRRQGGDPRFHLYAPVRPAFLEGLAFHLLLPLRVARQLKRFQPDAMLVQGTHETVAALIGRSLARSRTKLILDIHGDWHTVTRLYGSPLRRLLSPLADSLARFALRRADAVRTISDFTTNLVRNEGVEPTAVFPAYVDLGAFLTPPRVPLPDRKQVLFVGVLERYKGIDVLLAAWRDVVTRIPDAVLVVVGRGRLEPAVRQAMVELGERLVWREAISQPEVAELLDASTALVLPSRSEGLPRIVMEAFCRGRPVIGARSGGIPDLVLDGVNGLLVECENRAELAQALVNVLDRPSLAKQLADGAATSDGAWKATAEEFAERNAALVERAVAARRVH